MRLRTMVMAFAAFVAAAGVAAVVLLGQAQAASVVAGYTWSN